jgi:hypothetical protein
MPTFDESVAQERDRLQKLLAQAQERRQELDEELAGINRELRALDAYDAAKRGATTAPRTTTRGARGAQQEILLELITQAGGMRRADILEEVGVKGDKKREAAVSNALANMKKAGKLTLTDGIYAAA